MMRKKRETPDLNFITLACVSMIRVRVAAPRVEKLKISEILEFPPPYIYLFPHSNIPLLHVPIFEALSILNIESSCLFLRVAEISNFIIILLDFPSRLYKGVVRLFVVFLFVVVDVANAACSLRF